MELIAVGGEVSTFWPFGLFTTILTDCPWLAVGAGVIDPEMYIQLPGEAEAVTLTGELAAKVNIGRVNSRMAAIASTPIPANWKAFVCPLVEMRAFI